MIQQANVSVESQSQKEWQKELKQSYSRLSDLYQALDLMDVYQEEDEQARQLFSMRVPRPFVKLMKKGDPNDPLLLQVKPSIQEFASLPGYVSDPLEEHEAALPGLLHKYKTRVLIMFKTGCAVNCRYCFRRHFPYEDNSVNKKQLLAHIDYIRANKDINEVILSGGDPLMAKDDHIAWFLEQLNDIAHVTRLRIHSRLPVVIPSRLTESLIHTLASSRLNVVMVYHINHANEISVELQAANQKLRAAQVTVLNQAVLLKGVNDNLKAQVDLHERCFDAGILPYYLHVFDKVDGATHFDIEPTLAAEPPLEQGPKIREQQSSQQQTGEISEKVNDRKAWLLHQDMLKALPGFLVPKLVREIGGEESKTPIHPF